MEEAAVSVPSVAPQDGALKLSFSGRGSEYVKKLIKGYLLMIPTVGLYRFWLTTNLRRHLWSNTQIEGEPLEYTGTGKELLVGFLIALAVLLPVILIMYGLPFLIGMAAYFVFPVLMVGLILLSHYAVFGGRRYIATRTLYRGIRFWVEPAGWGYAFRALGWDFLTVITLGICIPWRIAALERYKMRFTQYGDLKGTFVGTGGQLFHKLVVVYLLIAAIIALAAIAALLGTQSVGTIRWVISLGYFAIALLIPYLWAVVTRWHLSSIRFGNVSLQSHLSGRTMYGLWLKCTGSLILFIAIVVLFVMLTSLIVAPELGFFGILNSSKLNPSPAQAYALFAAMVVLYVFFFASISVISRYFFHRGLWVAIVTSLTVNNPEQLKTATASGYAADRLGAGLADALGAEMAF